MDKVTSLAYVLYQSKSLDIKEKAIQLLNGDVSLHDLKTDKLYFAEIQSAESFLKKNKLDKNYVQQFTENFLLIEA